MPGAVISGVGGLISGLGKKSAASSAAKAYLAAAKIQQQGYTKAGAISATAAMKAAQLAAKGYPLAAQQQVASGDTAIATQRDAEGRAIGEQRGQLDEIVGSMKPYTDAGRGATYSLADLYGLPTASNPQGGQPLSDEALDAFRRSPDYQFAMDEAIKGADRSAAARGGLISGGQQAGVARLASGLATQNFGNYFDRLKQLSEMGQRGEEYVGNARLTTGRDIADIQQNTGRGVATTQLAQGDARARGILGQRAALAGGITGAAGARAAGIAGGTNAFTNALQQAAGVNAAGTSGLWGDIAGGVSDAFNQASFIKMLQGGATS